MSWIKNVFNIFSRREDSNTKTLKPIPQTFVNRFMMLLSNYGYTDNLFQDLGKELAFLYGDFPELVKNFRGYVIWEETIHKFLFTCKSEQILDTIEMIFKVQDSRLRSNEEELITAINEIFKVDDLPYYLTSTIWEDTLVMEFGKERKSKKIKEL